MGSVLLRHIGRALAAVLASCVLPACGNAAGAGSTPRRDAGSENQASSDAGLQPDVVLPSATDFADVNVPADFTQPVELPPPATVIAGDGASLVGSWVELADDGSVCNPATSPLNGICFHIDIQKDAAGAVEGTIHTDLVPNAPSLLGGPPAPATDPSVGYPPSVSPDQYLGAEEDPVPNVDYRLLDGVVANGTFTFWFSPLDLWSSWCALQTPSAWNVNGSIKYRCVPQTATPANTDLGKFDLCTSAEDGAQCTQSNGRPYPCACIGPEGGTTIVSSLPGCGRTVCECSATRCRADLRSSEEDGALTLQGGKLVGPILIASGLQYSSPSWPPTFTFQRTAP